MNGQQGQQTEFHIIGVDWTSHPDTKATDCYNCSGTRESSNPLSSCLAAVSSGRWTILGVSGCQVDGIHQFRVVDIPMGWDWDVSECP